MSMGDAWKGAFNDRVAWVDPLHRKARPKLEVLENSEREEQKRCQSGVKCLVAVRKTKDKQQGVARKAPPSQVRQL